MQTTQILEIPKKQAFLRPYSRLGGKGPTSQRKGKETAIRQLNKQNKTTSKLKAGKTIYTHNTTTLNPNYAEGLKILPFESCLIHDKCEFSRYKNEQNLLVRTIPKWVTILQMWKQDRNTNEINMCGLLETNELRASNYRKIKALDRFCNYYQPKYKDKTTTLLFLTFTRANYAKKEWKKMMNHITITFKKLGCPIQGFIWTSEISEEYGIHWHYHTCIAIDRVNWKKIPKTIKFEKIWGQRTEIDFVKKNVKHYMAKYFAKHNARIEGSRSYGMSRKFK